MSFLYLDRADLEALQIRSAEVVEAVDAACRAKGEGGAVMPAKLSLHGRRGRSPRRWRRRSAPGDWV